MRKAHVNKNKTKSTPYVVKYYDEDGKRREKPFQNETAANMFADELNNAAKLPQELTFTPAHRIEFAKILQLAQTHNVSLDKILDLVRTNIEQAKTKDVSFKDAFFAFKEDLERRNARPNTIKFYEQRCDKFKANTKIENLGDITLERANAYLERAASPSHAKRAMAAFLNFCIRRRWIVSNPFALAEIPRLLTPKAIPKIISIEQAQALFKSISDKYLPAFAVMAFAGVRPMEIISDKTKPVLDWGSIDFKKRQIRIDKDVAKTKKERLIAHAPGNLWAWLEKYAPKKRRGPVFPDSYQIYRKVKDAAGIELTHDILRHSFATYAYHTLGRDHTIEILGHDLGTFETYYKALTTKPEAISYFKIRPAE